jgi:hypothetical protein
MFDDGDEIFGANSYALAYALGDRIALIAIDRTHDATNLMIPSDWRWMWPNDKVRIDPQHRAKILGRMRVYLQEKEIDASITESDKTIDELIPL